MNDQLQEQLTKDLLIESFEGLDAFDRDMLLLEKGQGNAETLNNVFRIIHTLKGSSGCIGLNKIEAVAHVGESLLSLVRDGKLSFNPAMIGALLEYSDALKDMLRCLEQTGQQGSADYSPLLKKLEALQTGDDKPAKAPVAAYGLFEDEPEPAPAPQPKSVVAPELVVAKPREASPAVAPVKPAAEKEPAARAATSVTDTAIRVDVGQLD